jgi:cyclohexa-1,5-dienecarbonyl-CoA hydratase
MAADAHGTPVDVELRAQGAVWVVRLARPKANVLDAAMIRALTTTFGEARTATGLKTIVLAAQGPDFSFGASVQEHLPEHVAGMLHDFHALFRTVAAADVPVLAAVRGRCLGGGLELAAFCHRVFAAPDAKLGQPEIALGVFAPVASLLLPLRIGRAHAEDLCLSGRTVGADEALRIGLVDELGDDPDARALAWAEANLLRHSASSLRHAVRALRGPFAETFFGQLADLEHDYVHELMATADAVEGIQAFLQKRPPQWRNA